MNYTIFFSIAYIKFLYTGSLFHFFFSENGTYTKELQSIINITLSGIAIGVSLGGMSATKNTVDNFITNNEATRFISHFDARRALQQSIVVNFLRKGAGLGAKLGIFCFIFR